MVTRVQPPEGSPSSEPFPGASAPGTERGADPADGLDSLLGALRGDVRRVFDSFVRALVVEWQRIQLRAIDAFFRFALYLCILGFGLAASISAALLIVHGIREGLLELSHSDWIGDLGGGIVILGIVIGSGLLVRHHLRSEFVRKAKRTLAESRPKGSVKS